MRVSARARLSEDALAFGEVGERRPQGCNLRRREFRFFLIFRFEVPAGLIHADLGETLFGVGPSDRFNRDRPSRQSARALLLEQSLHAFNRVALIVEEML